MAQISYICHAVQYETNKGNPDRPHCHRAISKSATGQPLRVCRVNFMQDNTEEIWKDVIGYEGYYIVSSKGRIMSCNRFVVNGKNKIKGRHLSAKIVSTKPNVRGYVVVILQKDGKRKTFSAHRLVAQAFIPNPENKPTVNHKNGIKTDNRVENLEWATVSENERHKFDVLGYKVKRGERHHSSKPLYQYSKDGVLVNKWGSLMDAVRAGYEQRAISHSIKGNKMRIGYYWRREAIKDTVND